MENDQEFTITNRLAWVYLFIFTDSVQILTSFPFKTSGECLDSIEKTKNIIVLSAPIRVDLPVAQP